MRLRAAAEVVGVDTVGASVVDTAEVSAGALIWAAGSALTSAGSAVVLTSAALAAALISAALAAALISAALAISAGPARLSVAALRVSTSPGPAVTSAIKGISAAGVWCRALVTASMTTTTGAA